MALAECIGFSARLFVGILAIMLLFQVPDVLRRLKMGRNRRLFECVRCGNCCRLGFIELTDEDIRRIEGEGHMGFYNLTKSGEKKLKKSDGKCVFLVGDSCSIYESRPEVCRRFPFFDSYGLTYCRLWRSCPAVLKLEEDVKNEGRSS